MQDLGDTVNLCCLGEKATMAFGGANTCQMGFEPRIQQYSSTMIATTTTTTTVVCCCTIDTAMILVPYYSRLFYYEYTITTINILILTVQLVLLSGV